MKHTNCKTKKHTTYIWNASRTRTSQINDLECLDHDVICCRCGEEWGKHPATSVVAVSDKCAWCGNELPGTEEYYMQYGNACLDCRAKFADKYK